MRNQVESTDTHLAKKYGDVVFDCMMRCTVTGYTNESIPHYDNLRSYYASILNLYKNTFFLFEDIKIEDSNLSEILTSLMKKIKSAMQTMIDQPEYRDYAYFTKISEACDVLHMMVMQGLQKRKMLVRTSEREPIGQESIQYWQDKATFNKGDIKFRVEKPQTVIDDESKSIF